MTESILKKYVFVLIIAWTLIVSIILFFVLRHIDNDVDLFVKTEAIANFNKDQAIRHWASKQGGVYVEISSHTPSNPKLAHIKDRNIETLHGKKLTLMNPAYIVRQLNEYFADEYGIVGHITSTKLLRPENKPDAWEHEALLQFETGTNEVSGYSEINGKPYYRYIQPMMTLKSCLKCHDKQGYKVGDVRGGVSVSVPIQHILNRASKNKQQNIISYTLLWFIGLLGLFWGWLNLKKISIELNVHREKLEELVKIRTEAVDTINEELKSSNEELIESNDKLNIANKDLEDFNQLFIDREFRIKELRDKVKELEGKL